MDLRQAARDLERELDHQLQGHAPERGLPVVVMTEMQLGHLLAILALHSGDEPP